MGGGGAKTSGGGTKRGPVTQGPYSKLHLRGAKNHRSVQRYTIGMKICTKVFPIVPNTMVMSILLFRDLLSQQKQKLDFRGFVWIYSIFCVFLLFPIHRLDRIVDCSGALCVDERCCVVSRFQKQSKMIPKLAKTNQKAPHPKNLKM